MKCEELIPLKGKNLIFYRRNKGKITGKLIDARDHIATIQLANTNEIIIIKCGEIEYVKEVQ